MSQSLIPLIAVLILRMHAKAWAAYFMGIKCPLPQPLRAPTRWPNSLGQIYRQSQKLTVFLWRDSDNICTPRQRNQFWYKACKACLIPKFGNFNSILCTLSFVSDENLVSKYKSRPFNILGLEIDYHTQQAVSQESAKGPMFIEGFYHQAKSPNLYFEWLRSCTVFFIILLCQKYFADERDIQDEESFKNDPHWT